MKILMLSPNQITRWNPGHQQFRNAIGEQHDVKYYGPGYTDHTKMHHNNHLPHILQYYHDWFEWRPDAIMTYGWRYTLPFSGLKECKIMKIHFVCDFTPAIPGWMGTRGSYMKMMRDHDYDLYFAMSYQVIQWFTENWPRKKVLFLPFGVDEKVFKPLPIKKENDVYVGWSNHEAIYPLRGPVEAALRDESLHDFKVLIKRVFGQGFVLAINRAKINLNTSNAFRTMNMKNFEVMACRSVLITERVQEMDDLGFVEDSHYVSFSNVRELLEKIHSLIDSPRVMGNIATLGYKRTMAGHTNRHRVAEMTRGINEY